MKYSEYTEAAATYVRQYMQEQHNPALVFHNIIHTESVVAVAQTLALHYKVSDAERCVIVTAAWFHDIGYFDDPLRHEEIGAQKAVDFLTPLGAEQSLIDRIVECILATRLPQHAVNLREQIVCDADLAHLGTPDFQERSKLLRKEVEQLHHTQIDKETWWKTTIEFLERHQYYTGYCREHLEKEKQKNLKRLKRKVAQLEPSVNPITSLIGNQATATTKAGEIEEKKASRPERTIETMFRITSTNSQKLSDQADSKAHILISVNSIIISVLLSVVVRRIDEHSNLTIPLMMLLSINLLTIVFSILATRPNIPAGVFAPEDLEQHKVNLLFFGNFYRMSFEHYTEGMFKVMDDAYLLKLSLLRDIYNQGVVLGRKYRMLKTAYNIFMYGMVVSVIAFFIAARY